MASACSAGDSKAPRPSSLSPTAVANLVKSDLVKVPKPAPALPGGGRSIFPKHRLVGFVGGRSPAFGRLEPGRFEQVMRQITAVGKKYDNDGKTILPVFELVAVIAHPSPTDSGLYRTFEPDELIDEYLGAAREHGALLLLNVQPGRADFIDDVKKLEKWLVEPDVGVALDPEWAVGPGEVPGRVYGATNGQELNQVARYLSKLVAEHSLPEKAMVYHQVHESVVDNEAELRGHRGVVPIKSVDGIGSRGSKEVTWDLLMPPDAPQVHAGFKLFFEEDAEQGALMTPRQVMQLKPKPDYVMYE